MGYEIVETPAAKYYVISEVHHRLPELPSVRFDSVLFEYAEDYQKESPVELVNEEQIQRWTSRVDIGDVSSKNTNKGRLAARLGLINGIGLVLIKFGHPLVGGTLLSSNFIHILNGLMLTRTGKLGIIQKTTSKIDDFSVRFMVGKKFLDFRDAIAVEKVEKVIAPGLSKEINRKPVIGIVYGAAHATDIIRMLRKPTHRRRTLAKIPASYREPQVENLCTLKYDRGKWDITYHGKIIQLPAHQKKMRRIKSRVRLVVSKIRKRIRRR